MKTQGLDEANIPQHIAIIMDGNRRWARKRSLPDIKGHEAGSGSLEKVVEAAEKLGIETITVYALSTENIKERAKREVFGLFNLMRQGYRTKIKKMMGNGVKVNILGELEGLPSAIKEIIKEGININKINDEIVAKHLYTKGIPDPELVIRTGGRSRLSNFLLWQTAYSEGYFTKTLWPDFDGEALKRAIAWYQEQKRNFGR